MRRSILGPNERCAFLGNCRQNSVRSTYPLLQSKYADIIFIAVSGVVRVQGGGGKDEEVERTAALNRRLPSTVGRALQLPTLPPPSIDGSCGPKAGCTCTGGEFDGQCCSGYGCCGAGTVYRDVAIYWGGELCLAMAGRRKGLPAIDSARRSAVPLARRRGRASAPDVGYHSCVFLCVGLVGGGTEKC